MRKEMSSACFRSPVRSGPKMDPRREVYELRYGLHASKMSRTLTDALMEQLGACKSEDARSVFHTRYSRRR